MECLVCGQYQLTEKQSLIGSTATSCENCGSFIVPRVYSVPLKRELIEEDLIELVMLCREFEVNDVESVKKIYRSSYVNLYKTSRYSNATLSVLALHIYMNNENRVSPLKEYCKYMGVRVSSVKRLLDRLGPTELFKEQEWKALLANIATNIGLTQVEVTQTLSLIELLDEKIEINMNILSACIYRSTNLSLRKVARAFYISRQTVLKYNKKLEEII